MSKELFALLLLTLTFAACKKESGKSTSVPRPEIKDIEIGLNNNEIGVIGRDFHFNAKILAGYKIETVKISIQPNSNESYTKPWRHDAEWSEYRDAKNATVHKHFTIPTDAAEGKYDFVVTVTDLNGSKREVTNKISIYDPVNLPVDPRLSIFNLFINGEIFYRNGKFTHAGRSLKRGDLLNAQTSVSNVKGDGKMYLLLIKKSLNHRPESISAIDFKKTIVYDYFDHKNWTTTQSFSNTVFDEITFTTTRGWPDFAIGASSDNHTPPALIAGEKSWSSGSYYFGMIYHNTTYNLTSFNYIELVAEFN